MTDRTWITSCNSDMYHNKIYGRCLDSWANIQDKKILYSEDGFAHPLFENRSITFEKNFGKRVMRFYSKALAIFDGLKKCNTRYLIWLDSDVEITQPLDFFPTIKKPISSMFYPFAKNVQLSLIDIKHSYGVDTGIIIFDLETLDNNFADEYISYWKTNKLFEIYAPKDTWVLCDLTLKYDYQNLITEYKEYPVGANYFEFTDFKDYFIHHIGKNQK